MRWENDGFQRDGDGKVWILWGCSNCDETIAISSLQKPTCKCPNCGEEPNSDDDK